MRRLNETYLKVIEEKKGIKESLDHMIETESYRWICNATYSLDPQPLRSQRNNEEETTVVPDSVNVLKKQKNAGKNIFFFIFIGPIIRDSNSTSR